MKVRTFTAVIHREESLDQAEWPEVRMVSQGTTREQGFYVAECPEVGTVSQGTTVEEAVANLKEATELYLEEFPLSEGGRPFLTTFEATYA